MQPYAPARFDEVPCTLVAHDTFLSPSSLPHPTYWDLIWFCHFQDLGSGLPISLSLCIMGPNGYVACPFHETQSSSMSQEDEHKKNFAAFPLFFTQTRSTLFSPYVSCFVQHRRKSDTYGHNNTIGDTDAWIFKVLITGKLLKLRDTVRQFGSVCTTINLILWFQLLSRLQSINPYRPSQCFRPGQFETYFRIMAPQFNAPANVRSAIMNRGLTRATLQTRSFRSAIRAMMNIVSKGLRFLYLCCVW